MFNSSKDVGKTVVISPRKSSGICINVPERVAQNAQGLIGNGKTNRHQQFLIEKEDHLMGG